MARYLIQSKFRSAAPVDCVRSFCRCDVLQEPFVRVNSYGQYEYLLTFEVESDLTGGRFLMQLRSRLKAAPVQARILENFFITLEPPLSCLRPDTEPI